MVLEDTSFLDLTIPCLKIATYIDSQLIFAFIDSFGIPIVADVINIPLIPEGYEPPSLENAGMTSSEDSENSFQSYDAGSSADVSAFHIGEWVAFGITTMLMVLVAVLPDNPYAAPAAFIACVISLSIAWSVLFFPDTPSETKRGLLAGFGTGLFIGGAGFLVPPIRGGITTDILLGLAITFGLYYIVFGGVLPEVFGGIFSMYIKFPPFPEEIPLLSATIFQGTLSAILYGGDGIS